MEYIIVAIVIIIGYCFWEHIKTQENKEAIKKHEEVRKLQKEEGKKHWIRGEFSSEKFFEDLVIKDKIKEKMCEGYYDDYLLGTILNVNKDGVENILKDCEYAVEHYSGKGNEHETEEENKSKAKFFSECVALCEDQLKEIAEQEKEKNEQESVWRYND